VEVVVEVVVVRVEVVVVVVVVVVGVGVVGGVGGRGGGGGGGGGGGAGWAGGLGHGQTDRWKRERVAAEPKATGLESAAEQIAAGLERLFLLQCCR
jgi:hypothetical protein